MRPFKKLIIVIVLVLVTASNSFAVLPVLLPYIIPSLIVNAGVAGALIYSMVPGVKTKIDQLTFTVKRPVTATWIDLTMDLPLQQKSLNANMPFSKLQSIVATDKSKYSLLYPALIVDDNQSFTYNSKVGDRSTFGDDVLVIDAISPPQSGNDGGNAALGIYYQTTAITKIMTTLPNGADERTFFYTHVEGHRVPSPRDPLLSRNNITDENLIDVSTSFQSEIDKAFQDPTYIPEFTDATTGLPFSTPSGVSSAASIAAYNNAAQTSGAAATSAGAATASNQSAVTNAQTAVNNYTAANPGSTAGNDPVLKGLTDTLTAVQNALAGSQATEAELSAVTTAPGKSDAYGDKVVRDFGSRTTQFLETCKTSSLFSLPAQIVAGIPSDGGSVYSFSCGNWGTIAYDFANMAPALASFKVVFLLICGWCAIRIVTKGGGV